MPNYQATINGFGVLLDGMLIPADPTNRHWRRYLAWLTAGGSPAAAPELALAAQKAQSTAEVLAEASALVAKRTPQPSDAYVFQLELVEAEAAQAASGQLLEADYPLLAALVDQLGTDLDEVAQAVVDRQAATITRIAAVHTKRSEVLTLIEAQATSAEVLTAVTNISWPAEATAPTPV